MGWLSDVGSFIKDNIHTVLDVAGMIPGIGAVADLANAAVYAAEGDWGNAAMSAVSAIPGVGDTLALASKGVKAGKAAVKGMKAVSKGTKGLKALLKSSGKSILNVIKGKAKAGAKALKNWKDSLKSIFKKKKKGDKVSCAGGKCFTGDTLVYTEKGYLPIREVKVGDNVYSKNEKKGETGYKSVEQISIIETHTIHFIAVNENDPIKTTAYHPFYVEERGWVSAINLKKGDRLITLDGFALVTSVRKERYEEPVAMYNFHVEDWVSYFVSELNIYVHNGGSCKGSKTPGGKGKGDKFKWGNSKSKPTYGHTFTEHGAKKTSQQLTDRAHDLEHQVGKWENDQKAADFIADVAKRGEGTYDVQLPSDVSGRSFLPKGTEIKPDMGKVVVKSDGSIRTAYPYNSSYPTSKPK